MLKQTKNKPWLVSKRTVRFGDTDAAGVMHFYKLFNWCHEAWEESLENYGIRVTEIFPRRLNEQPKIYLPIVSCTGSFYYPISTGDKLKTEINPTKINMYSFQVETVFSMDGKEIAKGFIKHVSIDKDKNKKTSLPESIEKWLEASSINFIPKPI